MTLEEKLGYFFFDKRILARALTRRAYAVEQQQNNQVCDDQEAYLVVGAAVLKLVLSELLMREGCQSCEAIAHRLPDLEQPEYLATISEAVGISYVIKLSSTEKQQRAYDQPVVLAESLAAVLGGIYFDGGFRTVREVICRLFPSLTAIS